MFIVSTVLMSLNCSRKRSTKGSTGQVVGKATTIRAVKLGSTALERKSVK